MFKWTIKHRNPNKINLLNPSKIVKGFKLVDDGSTVSDIDFAHSDYISVDENTTYNGTSSKSDVNEVFITVLMYDENKHFISGLDWGGSLLDSFTPVSDCKFVRICFVSEEASVPADLSQMSMFAAGGSFSPYYIEKEVNPRYNNLNRNTLKTKGEQFYRELLNGKIKFINQDYDYIQTLNFRELIFLKIEDLETNPNIKMSDYHGQFYKTDCDFDADNKTVEATVNPDDDYLILLTGQNKKFNLSEKNIKLDKVVTKKKPVLQVYTLGSPVVTNVQSGQSFEEEIVVNPIYYGATMTNYGFTEIESFIVIENSYGGGGGIGGIVAAYRGRYNPSSNGVYTRTDGRFRIEFRQFSVGNGFQNWALFDNLNNPTTSLLVSDSEPLNLATAYALLFTPFTKSGVSTILYLNPFTIFTRWLTNNDTLGGVNTNNIPENDIVELNTSYSKYGNYTNVTFEASTALQDEPTVFGEVVGTSPSAGKFYTGLVDNTSDSFSRYTPVGIGVWNGVSLWFKTDEQNYVDELSETEDITIRNAFSLHNLISILLREIGSPVIFNDTVEFSEILFSTNNPLGTFEFVNPTLSNVSINTSLADNLNFYFISKESFVDNNLLFLPDKVDVTLKNILDVLKDSCKIYWHIEDKKLRFEHISWYQNGGTYDSNNKLIGVDLTELINLRNRKDWGFASNKWSYDKQNMPERFEFSWMDKVSVLFEGNSIQVNDDFVELGYIVDTKVDNVTTDVDYVINQPGEVSKTGLIMIGCVNLNSSETSPFVLSQGSDGKNIINQNGFLSFLYLHPKFYVFDLPSDSVNINGSDIILTENTSRQRQQTVTYPFYESDNLFSLIRTDLGVGQIEKIEVNLESKITKTVIKHDTE